MIAEVLINTNAKELNRTFDYGVSEGLKKDARIGSRVVVSFGMREEKIRRRIYNRF